MKISLLTVALAICLPLAAHAELRLAAFTEEWAPYNYSEQGEIKGIATEILLASCQQAAIHCEISVVPWARAYETAKNFPNTLVYTTARKPEREALFIWVGPVLPRTTWVFTRTNLAKQPNTLTALNDYKIGVVNKEAATSDLLQAGIVEKAFVLESTNTNILKLLQLNMVDAMVDTEIGMSWGLKNSGMPADLVTKRFRLSDQGGYYFALNPKTDPEIVRRLQSAIAVLHGNGRMEEIIRHYR